MIKQMILDTALKPAGEILIQVASIPLACYLLDADLANFGREDFFEKSELQRREIGEAPHIFRAKTRELMLHHKWLTPAARDLWQGTKEENLQKLLGD